MIDTVSFDVFMPDLEPELTRCPIPVIERRLREAAIEACEDANIWPHTEIITLEIGVKEYDMAFDDNVDIHSVVGVTSASSRSLVLGSDFTVSERGTITLTRSPTKVSELSVCLTLKPSRSALVVGRVVYRDNYRMLIQGTLSKAFDMKNRVWSNPAEARKHRAIFEEEIADARRSVDRGFVTTSLRVNPRFYAMPTQRSTNPFGGF